MINFSIPNIHYQDLSVPLAPQEMELVNSWLPESLSLAAEGRKDQFLAGRACVKLAAQKLGYNLTELPIGEDRRPIWPDNIIGSISHTKDRAIAVVARKCDFKSIGIDIEKIISSERFDTLKNILATPSDKNFLTTIDEINLELVQTILFSAKESLYKCINPFTNKYIEFKEASFVDINLENGKFTIKLDSSKEITCDYNGVYSGQFVATADTVTTLVYISTQV